MKRFLLAALATTFLFPAGVHAQGFVPRLLGNIRVSTDTRTSRCFLFGGGGRSRVEVDIGTGSMLQQLLLQQELLAGERSGGLGGFGGLGGRRETDPTTLALLMQLSQRQDRILEAITNGRIEQADLRGQVRELLSGQAFLIQLVRERDRDLGRVPGFDGWRERDRWDRERDRDWGVWPPQASTLPAPYPGLGFERPTTLPTYPEVNPLMRERQFPPFRLQGWAIPTPDPYAWPR